jgi:hypothetical protein
LLLTRIRQCHRYWGKRDTKLILPTNSSLSVTLDQDNLRSTTTSRADPSFTQDRLWLNGKEEEIKAGGRTATCIAEMKRLRKQEVEDKQPNEPKVSAPYPHPYRELYNSCTCSSLPSRFISPHSITSPQLLASLLPLPALRPWSRLLLSFTNFPCLRLPCRLLRAKVLVQPAVLCTAVSSLGSKAPNPMAQTPLPSKSLPRNTGPTCTLSSASSRTTRKAHLPPAECNAP